jgi:hypothetical protein
MRSVRLYISLPRSQLASQISSSSAKCLVAGACDSISKRCLCLCCNKVGRVCTPQDGKGVEQQALTDTAPPHRPPSSSHSCVASHSYAASQSCVASHSCVASSTRIGFALKAVSMYFTKSSWQRLYECMHS